jgi:hypothetical protein
VKALCVLALLFAMQSALAFDANGVKLGDREKDVRRAFQSAHCKALEWASRAADRRCDDARVAFGGVEVQATFYLKKDTVEAFDLRFDTRDLERLVAFLKTRYGAPTSETRDTIGRKDEKARQVYSVLWQGKGERAVLTAQLEKRRASMLVYRGDFEEEIYRVR